MFGSNGQMSLQLTNFPTGTNYYFCHQGDPSQYPTVPARAESRGPALVRRGDVHL